MALGNFFDKAALAAHQVLRGVEPAAFADRLNEVIVALAFDQSAAKSAEGGTLLDMEVELLARLYPRIALVATEDGTQARREQLAQRAREINPTIEIATQSNGAAVTVAVGRARVAAAGSPVIYAGSTGWIARLASRGPVPLGESDNPFGAAAAACLAAANVFRAVFRDQLEHAELDDEVTVSLVDLDPSAVDPANPALDRVDIGETLLAGVGAIGNTAVWTLAKLTRATGSLHLIDNQLVALSNLQRYVLTDQRHAQEATPKVELAEQYLVDAGIRGIGHQLSWGAYLNERDDWNVERVLVAVDSAETRRAVQAALPRLVLNAWTQLGDLGVSRHRFVDDEACACCLYFPEGANPNEDEIIARAIGLADEVPEVRKLLVDGTPIGVDWIGRIAAAVGVRAGDLARYTDLPLREFYTDAICGGALLALGGSPGGVDHAEAPLAFQSAMAGVLLAAELVIDAAGLRARPAATTTTIDVLRPLGLHLSQMRLKVPSGRCICLDPDYIAAYQEKFGLGDGVETETNVPAALSSPAKKPSLSQPC